MDSLKDLEEKASDSFIGFADAKYASFSVPYCIDSATTLVSLLCKMFNQTRKIYLVYLNFWTIIQRYIECALK
jgi:hypothetical protein